MDTGLDPVGINNEPLVFEQLKSSGFSRFMHIDDYDQKVEAIRRYRAAKEKRRELLHGANMLTQVKLWFDGEHYDFTLSGNNEMPRLLGDFPDIGSVEDLFSDRRQKRRAEAKVVQSIAKKSVKTR